MEERGAGWGKGGPTDPARGGKGRGHKNVARSGGKGKNGAKIENQELRKHRKRGYSLEGGSERSGTGEGTSGKEPIAIVVQGRRHLAGGVP